MLGFLVVLVVIAVIFLANLSSRVSRLEEQIRAGFPAVRTAKKPQEEQEDFSVDVAPVAPLSHEDLSNADSSRFIAWLREDWLLKLGGLLLLIGFGWLTTYAFMNDWIGPMGRITIGILAGVALLLLGAWRIRTFVHQGGVFLVIGSTTILLTVFAARAMYGFFTPVSALGVMFLSSAFVAIASMKHDSKALSMASIILAAIAPMLTAAPSGSDVLLFAYLLTVILGTVWLVAVTGQRELTFVALLVAFFHSMRHFGGTSPEAGTLLMFAYAFAAVFFITNTVGILRFKGDITRGSGIIPDLFTAAGNGLFLIVWIITAAPVEWRSLIIVGWMLAFVVGAFAAFMLTGRREPFYVYAGVGVAMLAAATATELQGAALTIALTVECATVSIVTYLVLREQSIAENVSVLFAGPVLLSLGSITSRAWQNGMLHEDFFVLLTLAIALLALGSFYLFLSRAAREAPGPLAIIMLIAGSLYAYVILWLSLHAEMANDNLAVMIALTAYTLVGLMTYFLGGVRGKDAFSIYGGALLGFVVMRLLLVDVWDMAIAMRIVTFFLIGILLMSTAFFRKRASVVPSR